MSIFDWFSGKKAATQASACESSGLGHVAATAPQTRSDNLPAKLAAPPGGHAAQHKIERLENRELIYSVVRDSMIRAGVLAAGYKFKVLSLDARGLQYLIMMDLVNQSAGVTAHLAEIEAMMAEVAKVRHNMTVTAVYWRVNEQVTASPSQRVPQPSMASAEQPSSPPATPVPPTRHAPAYEPLQEDEVAAFKRALASVTPAAARWASGQVVTSRRRNPAPPADFEDTQRVDSNRHASPLSVTQYGDLN
jgi:hypothetical protein